MMSKTNIASAWVEAFERLRSNPISQPVRIPIDYRGRSIPKWGEYLEVRRSELFEFRELCGAVAQQLVAAGESAEAKLMYSMERCGLDSLGTVTFPLVEIEDALRVCSAVKVMAVSIPTVSGATVDERMKAELAANLEEVAGLSAKQWADRLNCSKSAVADTKTWESLQLLRGQEKALKALDRRGRNLSSQTPSGPDRTGR